MIRPNVDVSHEYSTGLWNDLPLVVVDDSVEHWLNGQKVLSYRYHSPAFWRAVDASNFSNYDYS